MNPEAARKYEFTNYRKTQVLKVSAILYNHINQSKSHLNITILLYGLRLNLHVTNAPSTKLNIYSLEKSIVLDHMPK